VENLDGALLGLKAAGSTTTEQITQIVAALKALEAEINSIKREQANLTKTMEAASPNPATTNPGLPPAEARTPTSEKAASPPAPKETTAPDAASISPEKSYQMAYADYSRGNFDLALEGFSCYLSSLPQGSLAPNAQYWLGECYFSRSEFERAIEEFDRLIKDYPKSPQVSSALLKKGYSYLELKEKGKARRVLEELIKRHPRSREAALAKEKLRQVR
jgi:tol-pal system protein YbgF